ncbi:MAG: hypothetical protein ACR5KW_01360 [Wolbachia sp.]
MIKINKIISNMEIIIVSAVTEVELIFVPLNHEKDKTLLTIQISSEHKPSGKSLLVDKLNKKK